MYIYKYIDIGVQAPIKTLRFEIGVGLHDLKKLPAFVIHCPNPSETKVSKVIVSS